MVDTINTLTLNKYLTKSSYHNVNDISQIINSDKAHSLFSLIGLDQCFENKNLQNTFSELCSIYQSLDNRSLSHNKKKFNPTNSFYQEFDIPNDSLLHKGYQLLNTIDTYNITIDLNSKEVKFKINFYHTGGKSYLIERALKRLITLIKYNYNSTVADTLPKSPKQVEIDIVLVDVGRSSPLTDPNKKAQKEGTYDVSSGFTSVDSEYMRITRTPCILNLLVHELGHLLLYDGKQLIDSNRKKYQFRILSGQQFNVPINMKEIYFFETYCETNTTILSSMFNAIEISPLLLKKDSYQMFQTFFKYEILYTIYHSAKILYVTGYRSFDDFFNHRNDKSYSQNARLFEYTILRSILLLYINQYIKLMDVEDNRIQFRFKDDTFKKKKGSDSSLEDIFIMYIILFINNQLDYNEEGGPEGQKLQSVYEEIFNYFIDVIKKTNINTNTYPSTSYGNLNMEYHCIDFNFSDKKIESDYYYDKYVKYKQKYLSTKNLNITENNSQ